MIKIIRETRIQKNLSEKEFNQLLSETLWDTLRVIQSSPTVNHITYKKMFLKLKQEGKEEFAKYLLDLAEDFEFFHPDNILFYRKVIAGELF